MQGNRDLYRAAAKAVNHRFFLVDVIENVDDYLDLLEALADATEEDTIDIHINSPGGDLAIVAQIVHHMTRTKGLVVTHAEGEVCSGGSLIFFSGHQLDVGDFSEFLAHGPHGYAGGKLQDRLDGGKHTKEYVRNFYEKVYGPFYSKAEINAILRGKEHYETADQMNKRLEKALEKMEKEFAD